MTNTSKSVALTAIFLLCLISCCSNQRETKFLNHGFLGANLLKFGSSKVHPSGLLELTNTSTRQMGQAFHGFPIPFLNSSNSSVSFSTSFVFAITPGSGTPGHGLAFVISPSMDFSGAFPGSYLGLFNTSNIGKFSNRILAVEFDTVQSVEMNDIDDNHVGINLNGMISNIASAPAAYYDDVQAKDISLKLASGEQIRVWIEYNAIETRLIVTLAPLISPKPNLPLLSGNINLSRIFSEEYYVGFSAATGTVTSTHLILGWSFSIDEKAQELDIKKLPSLPDVLPPLSPSPNPKHINNTKLIIICAASATVAIMILNFLGFWVFRRRKIFFTSGMRKFSYQKLSSATGGFHTSKLLGETNSGNFYKGELASAERIAVKRIPCDTRQQRASVINQIEAVSRISHKNLVKLLGYGIQGNQIYLVYEYVPKGSLDQLLFSKDRPALSWSERFNIIKGIASALEHLHNEGRRNLIHGNIKCSNVLLDEELHAQLGDYGNITTSYVAAELVETVKETHDKDVKAFGLLILEIVCGRRAIEPTRRPERISLVNWVLQGFKNGKLLQRCDPRIKREELVAPEVLRRRDPRIKREELVAPEVLRVLKTGLLCARQYPEARPVMKTVVQYLVGKEHLPNDDYLLLWNLGEN